MIQLFSKGWVLLTKGTGLFKYAAKLLVSILKDERCKNNAFNNVFNNVYVLRCLCFKFVSAIFKHSTKKRTWRIMRR